MITAGIDAGAENTKVVILGESEILAYSIVPQGIAPALPVAQKALTEAAERASISPDGIQYVVSTGIGSEYVSFAHEQATESSCCARGVTWWFPHTDTAIDIGADKCLVVKCQHGKPFRTARNDRCAAGTGRFLKIAAKPLGMEVEEMGNLSLQSRSDIGIESTCAVFAESEIISLIHQGYRPEDIAKAVFKGLASRIYTLVLKVGFDKNLVMVGGIAKNIGMVKAMEEQVGCDILVPEEPIISGALGAALIASENKKAPAL